MMRKFVKRWSLRKMWEVEGPATGARADVQGLRAFAVLSVVSAHLFGWPGGGFAGVDVFFVISGFLITGLLLREWEKTGHISAKNFYIRRAKRILPASLLTIVCTVIAGYGVLTSSRASSLLTDGFWASFFAANWRFLQSGTDYFAQGNSKSALQHFWSLSVEEQFYFVWPWILLLVLWLLARRGTRANSRVVAAGLIGLVSVASLAWAFLESGSNPTGAYFSSLVRAWELGFGALLACMAPLCSRISDTARVLMLWLGIAGLVASLFVITESSQWPAPWALLPVLSTVVVIASGTGAEIVFNPVLKNALSRYVGDISYSLYLWHFPVIILFGAYESSHDLTYYVLSLLGMFGLAIASYHGMEKPIHHSPWGAGEKGLSRKVAWADWRKQNRENAASAGLLLLAITSVLPAWTVLTDKAEVVAPSASQINNLSAVDTDLPAAAQAVQAKLVKALDSTSWPKLSPSVDSLPDSGMAGEFDRGCSSATTDGCVFNASGSHTIAVYGDSLGVAAIPMLKKAYGSDYRIKGLTQISCAMTELDVKWRNDGEKDPCLAHRAQGIEWIKKNRPDFVVVTQNYAWANRLKAQGNIADQWINADAKLVKELSPYTKRVIFMPSTVKSEALADCASGKSTPMACTSSPTDQYQLVHDIESSQLPSGAIFVDTEKLFCVKNYCPPFSGTTPTLADGSHPTWQYAEEIAPAFKALVEAKGLK